MPVKIYRRTGEQNQEIAWLCDDDWNLGPQIESLSAWLAESGATLMPADYVADVGFCWRCDARGGGAAFDPTTMRRMGEIGMSLYLSEYPGFIDELADENEIEPGAESEPRGR